MDAVRFGRALGFGARQAAKTVILAADAARAESAAKLTKDRPPSPPAGSSSSDPATLRTSPAAGPAAGLPSSQVSRPFAQTTVPDASLRRAATARTQARGVREGLGRFRQSAVEPAVRLSAVLWLEVMGVFFGLFAVTAATGLWRLRAEWPGALAHPAAHVSLLGAAAIFILFAYFSVSSFVRAHRRQRRPR